MSIWNKQNIENVVRLSSSHKETLENLGLRSAGGNYKTLKKYLDEYKIDTSHFIKNYEKMVNRMKDGKIKIEEILVENSNFSRTHLKNRLYEEGIKERMCEICGQDENWNGKRMSLILDHINGVYNDNRIENLRIVCPNCNSTLETHCGSNKMKKEKSVHKTYIEKRKVERPSYEVLKEEVSKYGYSKIGRKYGVSDNSIRKWIKTYEKYENYTVV